MYFLHNLRGLIGPLLRPSKLPSLLAQLPAAFRRQQLTLLERQPNSHDDAVETFSFKSQRPLAPRAGQHFLDHLPPSQPDDKGRYRFFTDSATATDGTVELTTHFDQPRSSFKEALFALQPGDTISARGPLGIFTFDYPNQPAVLLAGGIGITPFRAMLCDLDQRSLTPQPITLLYANGIAAAPFRSELDQLAAKHDWLTIEYAISPQHISEDTVRRLAADRPHYYLSGPPKMVARYYRMLRATGVPRRRIHRDIFVGY